MTGLNRLLLAVQEDLQNMTYVAGVWALGIMDKIITGPFWGLVNQKHSILELNPDLLVMKNK